ncbi:MAG: penicillin-binding protein, partial [Clostridiales bacterium]|nr:penicillin-binding protein [Clostridiales bacterium]
MSEGKHEKKRLSNELKQSAEKIKRKVQHSAGERAAAARSRSPREIQARRRKVGFIVGTVFAVLLLTMAFFAIIFSIYINKTMKNKVEVDLSAYDMSLATEMYAKNAETDEWEIYQTLYDGENRILLTGDQIPKALRDATVAIEDKRFYKHKGVDWRGTIRAVFSTVTGRGVQGGSTITQQLIKNVTGNDETTIKRKVTEIYRALQLEKRYDKDEILTCYLNTVYFGESCYGAQTASRMYFGKDAKDLTLAECASLIAITNNPSRYDPLISDWTLANNRSRQLLVLQNMYDQGIIKEKEVYEAACNEQVTFTNGYTCMGELKEGYVAPTTEEETGEKVVKANNSYFTDQVIEDVAKKFVEIYDLKDSKPDSSGKVISAYERAVGMVYSGGYKIYTTQNLKYQKIAENVFENTKYLNTKDSNGQSLQAAITVVDPYTGDVVAMVGGTGIKTADRGWNWATEVRQCGSAVKPVST